MSEDGRGSAGDRDSRDARGAAEGARRAGRGPDRADWVDFLSAALPRTGAELAPGLGPAELAAVEAAAGTRLPTELRTLLGLAVPLGDGWRDWRADAAGQLAAWDDHVVDGLLVDVEHRGFWEPAWGERPDTATARAAAVRRAARTLPRLFPLRGHRALAIDPAPGLLSGDGNPVFSVVQTDVITYGADLAAWFAREFRLTPPSWAATSPRRIPFWSDLAG
jgi:hypothetical protein